MLCYEVLSCTCRGISIWSTRFSHALACPPFDSIWNLRLHLHMCLMPCWQGRFAYKFECYSCYSTTVLFLCTCMCIWRYQYVMKSALAQTRTIDAAPWDCLLLSHTYFTLRQEFLPCACTHTWCYAVKSSLWCIVVYLTDFPWHHGSVTTCQVVSLHMHLMLLLPSPWPCGAGDNLEKSVLSFALSCRCVWSYDVAWGWLRLYLVTSCCILLCGIVAAVVAVVVVAVIRAFVLVLVLVSSLTFLFLRRLPLL